MESSGSVNNLFSFIQLHWELNIQYTLLSASSNKTLFFLQIFLQNLKLIAFNWYFDT